MPDRLVRGLLAALLIALPAGARAQEAGSAADLGQLLSLEDSRSYDGAALQRAAQHPDSLVRRYAAIVIGRLGDHAATPLLRQLLADPDSQVRIEAAFAAGSLGDRTLVPDLARLVAAFPAQAPGDFETEVVNALARLGGPEAEEALSGLLSRHPPSADLADRATATALLEAWRFGRRSSLARVLPDYLRATGGELRRDATYSVSRMRYAAAAPALLEITEDPDALTRSYVARAMIASTADSGRVPRAAFVARLRNLIKDQDPGVRINALRSLATFEDSSLVPLAAAGLVDRDPNVPVQAAATLGSLKGSAAVAALVERFANATSYGLRRAILLGLSQAAPATALETGGAWRTDSDWRYRATLAEMLAAEKGAASRQQLTAMLADQDPRVVAAALGALQSFVPRGDTALVALARGKLADPDVMVRSAAIGILGRERSGDMLQPLLAAYLRARTDQLNEARLTAVRALADLADSVPGQRGPVERGLMGQPRPADYLVRRLAFERFGEAALRGTWGVPGPVETGRTAQEYTDLARRYIMGQAPPGNVTIELEQGSMQVQLFAADAPLTVDNFLRLVDRRFFDNGRWHRVVPNFVVQDGDPRGDGSGGPGTTIRDEINRNRYVQGTVGMALSGPDTGGSQFFICHSPQPHLDGGYTAFGMVVAGWDVLMQVVQGDRIRRIYRS